MDRQERVLICLTMDRLAESAHKSPSFHVIPVVLKPIHLSISVRVLSEPAIVSCLSEVVFDVENLTAKTQAAYITPTRHS